MSQSKETATTQPAATPQASPGPESQHERWLKYGMNVSLTLLLVIVLAAGLTYLTQEMTQKHDWVWDTNVYRAQSLAPQTVKILQSLKNPVKIVALYPRLKAQSGQQDEYQPVADLLGEYQRAGGQNIQTSIIDPNVDTDKVDDLVQELTRKYGGDIAGYTDVVKSAGPLTIDVLKVLDAQLQPVGDTLGDNAGLIAHWLAHADDRLGELRDTLASNKAETSLDDESEVAQIESYYSDVNDDLKTQQKIFDKMLEAGQPDKVKAVLTECNKSMAEQQKKTEAFLARINKLPKLTKEINFKDQLKSKTILVEGKDQYRIFQDTDVWVKPPRDVFSGQTASQTPARRFAGEELISEAMVSLSTPKGPMVVFVHSMRAKLTQESHGGGENGPFSQAARLLREANFDVREFNPEQPEPDPDAPTPEELKSAIWVVVQSAPAMLSVAQHLEDGGAVMALVSLQTSFGAGLSEFGIDAQNDYLIMHEALPAPAQGESDHADELQRKEQECLIVDQYGNHPMVDVLEGRDLMLAGCVPIKIADKAPEGVTVTPILPLPKSPHCWATRPDERMAMEPVVEFNRDNDLDSTADKPLYAGAVAQTKGGGRLVVLNLIPFIDTVLNMKRADGVTVRLPGAGGLFVNSIYWLSKQDDMLQLGPRTPGSLIRKTSHAMLAFVRVGVLSILLPLLVVLAGMAVYVRRRD